MATSKPTGGNNTPSAPPAKTTTTPTGDTEQTLDIPTMAGPSAASILNPEGGPVLQDGEDGNAIEKATEPAPQVVGGRAPRGVLHQGPINALSRPVISRGDREVDTPSAETNRDLALSDIDKRLEDLRRSDLDLTPADPLGFKSHAALLAFYEEWLIINIHDTNEQGAENPLPLSINGSTILVPRDADMLVRRKYVELLMRMKPQSVNTRIDRSDPDNIKNIIEKRSSLRHPFSIVRDDNPLSRAWVKKIMSEV